MKILLTGANGFLGSRIKDEIEVIESISFRDFSEESIKQYLDNINPDIIIHTAAISDTGYCENHIDESYKANVLLPYYLAKYSKKIICFSSDLVYNGSDSLIPNKEEDAKPNSVYAKQKYEMEEKVLSVNSNSIILRIEWLYDIYSNKSNYLINLLNNNPIKLFKQYRGVTYVYDIVDQIKKIINLNPGIYNFGTNCSMDIVEMTNKLNNYFNMNKTIEVLGTRKNIFMDNSKIISEGICIKDTEDSLIKLINQIIKPSKSI